ncbi:peptide/nickel transport system permease protein [Nocardioides sp. J9]|uniref:ABC transporter permease n=1 Tax=unclassified Nocardioides TaxID=2615069 RepID=UPI00048AF089|nr:MULTISPECIES: ABC transporter permease [unclassified Nocardioides]TWG93521.1 peptide/nickel transport system permease protein [Nocardioides sp. J9]
MTAPSSDLDSHLGVPAETGEPSEAPGAVVSRSPLQLAARRFLKDKLSMASLIVVLLFFIAAVVAPFAVKFGWIDPLSSNQDLLDEFGLPIGDWGGISGDHWLGIEPGIGRDALARLWYGTTFSLAIAISATIVAMVIGVVAGIVSGAAGGWVDVIIGRIIDLTLAFPQTLMLLALSSVGLAFIHQTLGVPNGNPTAAVYVIVVLGLFGWTGIARIVRGQVLSLREREFVQAAQMIGASRRRIYFKEILPNLWAPILVTFTLMMPAFVSAEAALSFLGVGISAPTPTLGNVLTDALRYADSAFLYFFIPAFMIATLVVCFNLLGDGLRDALDPKADR